MTSRCPFSITTSFENKSDRYAEQAETHEAILAGLRAKYEPVENTASVLQERLSEIDDRFLEP